MSDSRGRRSWILRIALLGIALLASVPAFFAVRGVFFPPRFDVASIQREPVYQDAALMREAWALPVATLYEPVLRYQSNGSRCGPSSLANVLRSLGAQASEDAVLEGSGKCITGICFGGLTLSELAQLAERKLPGRVHVLRDLTEAQFRGHLARTNDPSRRYIVNFQRGLLFGKGTGHFSPIAGYLASRDLVLVLDVNEKFKPWLVDAQRLYRAMDSIDDASGQKRGLLLVQ